MRFRVGRYEELLRILVSRLDLKREEKNMVVGVCILKKF